MRDLERVEHAISADGSALVRYDRAGKWRIERSDGTSKRITVRDAAEIAVRWASEGGVVFPEQYGGKRLHTEIRKLQGTP